MLPLSPDLKGVLPHHRSGSSEKDTNSPLINRHFSPRARLEELTRTIDRSLGRSVTVGILYSTIAASILGSFLAPSHQGGSIAKYPIIPETVTSCESFNPKSLIEAGGGNLESIRRTGETTWKYSGPRVEGVLVPSRIVISPTNQKGYSYLPGYPLNSEDFSISCYEPNPDIEGKHPTFAFNPTDAEQALGGVWRAVSQNTISRESGQTIVFTVPDETIVYADRVYLPGDELKASRFSATNFPKPID